MPNSRRRANNLGLVLLVVHNGPNARAHNGQWLNLLRCFWISLREGIDIFGVRHHRFKFTPRNLNIYVELSYMNKYKYEENKRTPLLSIWGFLI